MELLGHNYIGSRPSKRGGEVFTALNPANGERLAPDFHPATEAEIDQAVRLAADSAAAYRALPAETRAAFLDRIADEIVALGEPLLERAHLETALPPARLLGERGRTVNQLKMFAGVVREGSWVEARIDPALPDRKPLPRPDLRRMLIPLGPVAVFGASNFPFAFSTAGGDTASAFAAGCPVVVKAHPAHPGVSEMTATAILRAAEATEMPEGIFSLLHGGKEAGALLVQHPLLQAVGFTGSLAAGRALFNLAAARERPIPVYAEMGSINPVFVLPGALEERGEAITGGLAQSITLGLGQFCTNPGLIVGLAGPVLEHFRIGLAAAVASSAPGTMLTPGIARLYAQGVERLSKTDGVFVAGQAGIGTVSAGAQGAAALFATEAKNFLNTRSLAEENFGPSSLLVACGSPEELERVAHALEGQLTASVHGTPEDLERYRGLISILETKVGRLIFNGFPTGVEVCPSMQHGGPYPSTTDSRTTSVGTAAIQRFARPLCYQDFPLSLLPVELQNENPRNILRLVNNSWTRDACG